MNIKGETGTVQVSNEGVGSPGLALFNKLIRAAESKEIEPLLDAYIVNVVDADEDEQEKLFEDLYVLVFETRDVLKGKGERDLFYELILLLFKRFPKTTLALLKFIPQFGYWKDLLRIIYFIDKRVDGHIYNNEEYSELREALISMYAYELKNCSESKKPTLSGKWAPREGSMYDNIATELAAKIFPEQNGTYRMRSYRKLISSLTRVVEQQMSSKKFSEIEFEHVPSKAMDKYKAAFLKVVPDNEDRIKCRENMQKFLVDCAAGKAKIKANTLMPHEVTSQVIAYLDKLKYHYNGPEHETQKQICSDVLQVLNVQWDSIVEKFVDDICKECKASKDDVIGLLERSIALSDVSGSMSGIPMDVSIGMGILISQFCKAFPNTIITFESTPGFFDITGEKLSDKIDQVAAMPWGGSTDFIAALRMMLNKAMERKISPSDFPKIMFVFSDMQFDAAIGDGYSPNVNVELRKKYSTNHEVLLQDFKKAGYEVPLVIYWNLRAGTPGHESSADVEGTVMLSGYNPTLLKSVFSGQDLSKIDFEIFKKEINPQKVYENVVSNKNYQCIRDALKDIKATWSEELLK